MGVEKFSKMKKEVLIFKELRIEGLKQVLQKGKPA